MGRVVLLAVAAMCAAAVAGCGAGEPVAGRAPAAAPATGPATVERTDGRSPATGPATVERTDGRLGDATAVRVGSRPRELSRGGRPDVRPRGDAPRRDGVGAGAACADPVPAPDALGAVAEATLCLLNGERADHGLAPLAGNEQLGAAASAYAQDLVAGSYFSHTGRDGSDVRERIARTGYLRSGRGWAIGENLAWGTGALATPGSIVQAWMNSPGHRANILNPSYREIGIGVAVGNPASANGAGATYATEFGVIEEPEAVAAAPRRPGAKSRAKKAVKRKKARASRRGDKGAGKHRRARSRGPKARISI
jgi:uncharacterized protein YkwD